MIVDVETYLHENIPISRQMGIRVVRADLAVVALTAPLEPNINHRSTVFGGSCASIAMLAAWSLILLRVRNRDLDARIVIQRGSMEYLLPIDAAFTATCRGVDEHVWERFIRTVERRRAARIELDVSVESSGRVVSTFRGAYAAVPLARVSAGAAPALGRTDE